MAKTRVVLEFDLNNPMEARVYDYLSNFGNGKKAIVMQAITHLQDSLSGNTNCYGGYPAPYPAPAPVYQRTERPVKEKKQIQENKPEGIRTEPVIEKVKEEPVVQAQAIPAVNSVPEPAPAPGYQQQIQEQYQVPVNNPTTTYQPTISSGYESQQVQVNENNRYYMLSPEVIEEARAKGLDLERLNDRQLLQMAEELKEGATVKYAFQAASFTA